MTNRNPSNFAPRLGLLLLAVLMLFSLTSCGSRTDRTRTVTRRFYADSPEDKYGFESTMTKDGKTYQLTDEQYKILKKNTAPSSHLDAISGSRTSFTPGKRFRIGEKSYTVQSVKTAAEPVSLDVAVKSAAKAPETVTREYQDKKTGMTTKLTYQLQEVVKNETQAWTSAGTFTINLVGYGGKYYDIGTAKLSGKNTLKDIQSKSRQVLEAQGLNPDENRISGVHWKGKPYSDQTGNPCRDVVVSVETHSAPLTAKYSASLYRFSVQYVPEGARPDQYLMEGTATYRAPSEAAGWVRLVLWLVFLVCLIFLGFAGRKVWKETRLLKSGKEIRVIDGVRYTEDDF